MAPGWPVHTKLLQSSQVLQWLPSGQGRGQAVPQSTSASLPFFTPSEQVGAAQIPAAQMPPWQSAPTLHRSPTGQGGQAGPPQSTSVSLPFLTKSPHVGEGTQ